VINGFLPAFAKPALPMRIVFGSMQYVCIQTGVYGTAIQSLLSTPSIAYYLCDWSATAPLTRLLTSEH
jgi:uncharacterized membrane protein